MMYPILTLDDNTEIVHSDMRPDGTVKVYLERPDVRLCFRHTACYLPGYTWEDIVGFTQAKIDRYQDVIESTARLILGFSQEGGFDIVETFRGIFRPFRCQKKPHSTKLAPHFGSSARKIGEHCLFPAPRAPFPHPLQNRVPWGECVPVARTLQADRSGSADRVLLTLPKKSGIAVTIPDFFR